MTTEEILKEYNRIIDEFYISNPFHSLTDFEKNVLELNKREELWSLERYQWNQCTETTP